MKVPRGFLPLAAAYFILKCTNSLFVILFTSLFLVRFGIQGLPWMYIFHTVFFIVSQIVILRMNNWKGEKFLLRMSLPIILVAIGLGLIGENPLGWVIFGAVVFFRNYDLHSTQSFFDLTGSLFSLRESKKFLPMILAAGTMGSILSGLILKFVVERAGFSAIAFFAAFLLIIEKRLLSLLNSILSGEKSEKIGVDEASSIPQAEDGLPGNFHFPPDTKSFCLSVIGISVLGTVSVVLVEFLFNGSLSIFLPTAGELASFLGIFTAITELTVFCMQGTIGSLIFTNLKLVLILSIRPLVLAMTCLSAFFFPSLASVTACQFLTISLSQVVMVPIWVLLVDPLPIASRHLFRRILIMGDCVSELGTALFLLFWEKTGGGADPGLFLLTSFLFFVTLPGNWFVAFLYPKMIAETLASFSGVGNLKVLEHFRFIPAGLRFKHLSCLLESESPDIRLRGIVELANFPGPEVNELLFSRLSKEKDSSNLEKIAGVLMNKLGKKGVGRLEDFLSNEGDPCILGGIIETLGKTARPFQTDAEVSAASAQIYPTNGDTSPGGAPGERFGGLFPEDFFLKFLSHSDPYPRFSSIVAILRQNKSRESIGKALDCLYSGVYCPDSRIRTCAAGAMSEAGMAVFSPALFRLAEDPEEMVARRAFRGLANLKTPGVLNFIAHRAAFPGITGKLANEAWKTAMDKDNEALKRIISGLTDSERKKVGFWLGALNARISPSLLLKLLRISDPERRDGLFKILIDSNEEAKEVVSECLKLKGAEVEIFPEPILKRIRETTPKGALKWGEFIPFLLGPRNPEFETIILGGLKILAIEAGIFARAKEIGMDNDQASLEERFQAVLHLTSLSGPNPEKLLDVMVKASSGDSFVNAVAIEYLDENLGKKIASLLLPLLERERNPAALYTIVNESFGKNIAAYGENEIILEFARLSKKSVCSDLSHEGG